jgi:hypothetical protein
MNRILDAEEIVHHASPVVHQHAHEIQPYGHLIKLPIGAARWGSSDVAPPFKRGDASVQVGNRRLHGSHPYPEAKRQGRTRGEDEKHHRFLRTRDDRAQTERPSFTACAPP